MRVKALAMRHPNKKNHNMANKSTTNNRLYMSPQHVDSSPLDENGNQTPLILEKIEAKTITLL